MRQDKEDGQLIINPKSVTLDEILSCITPDNIHHEVSTGGQQGREVW
ncbi:AbrB/MazE/SpoVT family DNA-binding domain-containing protein [Paenibacillus sp. FSL R7-0333]